MDSTACWYYFGARDMACKESPTRSILSHGLFDFDKVEILYSCENHSRFFVTNNPSLWIEMEELPS